MKRLFFVFIGVTLLVFAGCQFIGQFKGSDGQQCTTCKGSSIEQIVKSNYILLDDNYSYQGAIGKLYQNKVTGQRVFVVDQQAKKMHWTGTLHCGNGDKVYCDTKDTPKNCANGKVDDEEVVITPTGTKCKKD